jgi:hypothetical protein
MAGLDLPHRPDLRNAKIHAKQFLAGLTGVAGIGISWDDQGDPCLRVNISADAPKETRERIPNMFEGMAVQVRTVGLIGTE